MDKIRGSKTVELHQSKRIQDTINNKELIMKNTENAFINMLNEENISLERALEAAVMFTNPSEDTIQLLIDHGADINFIDKQGNNLLINSLEECRLDAAKLLINKGIDVNFIPEDGISALMTACTMGGNRDQLKVMMSESTLARFDMYSQDDFTELVQLLVEQGADINAKNNEGTTALLTAVMANNIEAVKHLIENGADVNAKRNDEQTALSAAVALNNIEAMQLLLQYGLNPNSMVHGVPLLNTGVMLGNIEAVKLLLQYKVDVNFITIEQNPLLSLLLSQKFFQMMAQNNEHFIFENFYSNKFEIAKLLIEYGVDADEILQRAIAVYLADKKTAISDNNNLDISTLDKIKDTLFKSNMFDVNLKTIGFLLENGANVNIAYEEPEMHPLCQAVEKNNLPLVTLLVQYADDIDPYSSHNKPSLFFEALKHKNYEIIEVLIESGAKINETILHITPLFYAIYHDDMKLAQMFVENGADVNQSVQISSHFTMSPLLYAVRFNRIEISKFLVEKGADVNYKYAFKGDEFTVTPLSTYEIANEYDDQILAEFFLLKEPDMIFPADREKSLFDMFENSCKMLDVFCESLSKQKNSTQLDREKYFESHPEIKEKIINLEQKAENSRQNKLKLLQSTTINKDIIEAIESRSMEKLQKLIDADFDMSELNINDLFINNFPHQFIYEVIRQSKNIDLQTDDGMTPLMFASQANSMELVKLLLDKGADKNIKNSTGKRARDFTADGELRKFIVGHIVPIDGPKKLSELLKNFSNPKLQYTNHDWDQSHLTYERFMKDVNDGWSEIKDSLKDLLSDKTYKNIEDFLFNDKLGELDSEGKIISWGNDITIGWSSKEMMAAGNKPHLYKNFKEAMDYFKSLFVIKQDNKDLKLLKKFTKLRKENNYKFNLDLEQIKEANVNNIFTDVDGLESALATMLTEINDRVDDGKDHVKVTLEQDESKNTVILKIIHVGSTSKSDAATLEKAIEKDGGFKGIYNNLSFICDWSVETICPDNKRYKVDYLYPEVDNNKPHSYQIDEQMEGFTHILRFYI
jgi:ankyrin repeat protein